jgi:hypothetical protein
MPSLWSFAGGGLSNYLLVIVSGFIFVVVALQLILSRVGRTKGAAQNDHNQLSLRDWAAGEFDTCQGRLSGAQAALQIVLPIAVAALGMTAFGIVRWSASRTRRRLLPQILPSGPSEAQTLRRTAGMVTPLSL